MKKRTKGSHQRAAAQSCPWRNRIVLGLILAFTYFLFSDAIHHQFVSWDDYGYVTGNMMIRNLSWAGIKDIITTPVGGMYNPLPFLVYAALYDSWALNPLPYHVINIILHLVATVVVYRFILKFSNRYEIATVVALFFAIHPMHVSVATWVSEAKTSLFVVFYILALGRYMRYVQDDCRIRHLLRVGVLFILALLSKPSAVTLPPMLLLFDYYWSRKLEKRLFLEKIPFFLVALCFGVLTLVTHMRAGDSIFQVNNQYSLIEALVVSNYSVAFYFIKLFFPFGLTAIYSYPEAAHLPLSYYFSIPVIPLILWCVYKAGSLRKEMIFGLLFFLIAISVVLRVVPSGPFGMANRYTYLSYTGLFFIVGKFLTHVLDNRVSYSQRIKAPLLVGLVGLVVMFSYLTAQRVSTWKNSLTLFDDVVSRNPRFALAYLNRGVAKKVSGDLKGALEDYNNAIVYDPKDALAYNNRGEVRRLLGDHTGAMEDYRKTLSLDPDFALAFNNMGLVHFRRGELEKALANYNKALTLNPKIPQAYYNRMAVAIARSQMSSAREDWEKAHALGMPLSFKPRELYEAEMRN
jgi:tetratricopeptide (TPR) repeat protein